MPDDYIGFLDTFEDSLSNSVPFQAATGAADATAAAEFVFIDLEAIPYDDLPNFSVALGFFEYLESDEEDTVMGAEFIGTKRRQVACSFAKRVSAYSKPAIRTFSTEVTGIIRGLKLDLPSRGLKLGEIRLDTNVAMRMAPEYARGYIMQFFFEVLD